MDLLQLNNCCYVLQGGANIGILAQESQAVVIDTERQAILQANRQRLEIICAGVLAALEGGDGCKESDLLATVARMLDVKLASLAQYCLARTTIQAAITSLVTAGQVTSAFHDNRLYWTRVS